MEVVCPGITELRNPVFDMSTRAWGLRNSRFQYCVSSNLVSCKGAGVEGCDPKSKYKVANSDS